MTYYNWVDTAKGIGILCVVGGHAINQLYPLSLGYILIRNLIYSFHIPLFFFLSGVLLNYSTNVKMFIGKKFRRLVIPYFFAYLIISVLLFISYLSIKIPLSFSGIQYLFALIYGTIIEFGKQTGTSIFDPLWFLTTLFCALMIGYILINISNKNPLLGFFSLIVTICLGYACSLIKLHLPWGFDIAMVSQLFIMPGFYFKKKGYAEIKKLNIIVIELLLIGFLIAFRLNGKPEMSSGVYNNIFLFWIAAICAIAEITYLSNYLTLCPAVNGILSFFGKNVLIIFCFHLVSNIVILYIALLIPTIKSLYYANIFFEMTCMLGVSIIFIFIIHKLRYVNKIFNTM